MKARKLASPLVASCRVLYHNLLDGVSQCQGTARLPITATNALRPQLILLESAQSLESSTGSREGVISSVAHRNCRASCSSAIKNYHSGVWGKSRFFSSSANSAGPAPADPSALLDEELFHDLADDILHQLQEKIEILGEDQIVDGFDSDYSSGVLTIRLGKLGTYVINKQTPNRQIWLSSPVSGPGRYDWVESEKVWVYRRTKAELGSHRRPFPDKEEEPTAHRILSKSKNSS
ncbi:hypothetical protein R1flu_025910 [Riccia fluitans]|uniref:ferroxidase n=1 Tax=Riccia fluitans TaxID=41844 RepID=A0ABD1Y395_9MARC